MATSLTGTAKNAKLIYRRKNNLNNGKQCIHQKNLMCAPQFLCSVNIVHRVAGYSQFDHPPLWTNCMSTGRIYLFDGTAKCQPAFPYPIHTFL